MLTAHSCRALAADDTLRASTADLPNQRANFHASAAAWNDRADFLDRIGRLNDARRASERTFPHG